MAKHECRGLMSVWGCRRPHVDQFVDGLASELERARKPFWDMPKTAWLPAKHEAEVSNG